MIHKVSSLTDEIAALFSGVAETKGKK